MTDKIFQWAIIGAGAAGIAAVGKLLDKGISPNEILWIDPCFQVGDLGRYWSNVSSNTTVSLFHRFLEACQAFHYKTIKSQFALSELPEESCCELSYMVEPLQWVSDQLSERVYAFEDWIDNIHLEEQRWEIHVLPR